MIVAVGILFLLNEEVSDCGIFHLGEDGFKIDFENFHFLLRGSEIRSSGAFQCSFG